MSLGVIFSIEPFSADWTLVRLLVCMYDLMASKIMLTIRRVCTNAATVNGLVEGIRLH
jgi:hypothetical protein